MTGSSAGWWVARIVALALLAVAVSLVWSAWASACVSPADALPGVTFAASAATSASACSAGLSSEATNS